MKNIFKKNKGEEHDFWMSYTDLMSGFLIVFIIASLVYHSQVSEIEKQLSGYSLKELLEMKRDYDKKMAQLAAKRGLLNINDSFKEVFDQIDNYEILPDSLGGIRLYPSEGEKELFKKDESLMESNLRNRIQKIGRQFVQTAIKLKNNGMNIVEIRIEGHADEDGDYMHNLKLSSSRAYAVYKYIYDHCGLSNEEKEFVENYVVSVGYSFARPVVENNIVDKDKSRRIEFRIISK